MDKFRWIYIGSGNIAASTARSIEKGNHKIVAVYSRNFMHAQRFAQKHGALACKSAKEAILHDADAVYIATSHTSHVEYALMSMRAGKPVLCEKPVGVCVKDVDTLVECARENDIYFTEAMWTWFSDMAIKVRHWVQNGEIGDVKSVTIHYAFPGVLMPKNSRVLTPSTAGGALLDIGIYPITYCYKIFGYPRGIKCDGEIKNGIDIKETVVLDYGSFKCNLHMSLTELREDCTITGSKGSINVPMFHMASKAVLKNEKRTVIRGKTDYLTEFSRVADEIRNDRKESDFVTFSDTRNCMKIMDECRVQMGLVYPFENKKI